MTDVTNSRMAEVLEGEGGVLCGQGVVRIDRAESPWASTSHIEEIDVTTAGGAALPMMLKDLSPQFRLPVSRSVRPPEIDRPEREVYVYREILAKGGLQTARLYGSAIDRQRAEYWLLIERVMGRPLSQCGEFSTWMRAASVLAEAHAAFGRLKAVQEGAGILVRYGTSFHRRWMQRAMSLAYQLGAPAASERRALLGRLAKAHERAAQVLSELPVTLVHGDYHGSNIIVEESSAPTGRLCPIDWENSGRGPGVIDLAALTAGWAEDERRSIARAYLAGFPNTDRPYGALELHQALDAASLCACVQWMGWSAHWRPPLWQARDWAGEALKVAARLTSVV